MTRRVRARSTAARRGRIALTLLSLAALGAGPAAAGPAAADATPMPLRTDGVWGVDYAGGVLTTVQNAPNGLPYIYNRTVSADGSTAGPSETRGFADTLAYGGHVQRIPCDAGSCIPLRAAGNGNVGYFFTDSGKERAQVWTSPSSYHRHDEPEVTGGRFVDVTGRYFVYQAASTGKQYIDSVKTYRSEDVRRTRPITAASVWGTRLYTPGSKAGAVSAYDLERKKTVETIATGAPCTVGELQVVGRWVYWNCGPTGTAGVYDRKAKKKIPVPSGRAIVGDGYLVRHDRTEGKLVLTDFHTGTAAEPRPVADLPAGNTVDQRRLTWAVDKFGGDIAYVDADHAVHVVRSGVPSQPLAKIESNVDGDFVSAKDLYWNSTWQLSKPAAWTFTVKDGAGRAVYTRSGTGAEVHAGWSGRTNAGTYAYNGAYTWTLTAKAVEGGGSYTTGGAFGLAGGLQGHHDQGGYSHGELVTLNSSGALTLHYTKGKGTFDFKQSGSGWPAGVLAVPFGDMGKDRCSEMLVRTPGGELRRYTGRCGAAYAPSHRHASLGTGWKAYDVLTAPGDLTGDGRTDLLARKASTGDVHLFADDGAGKLERGVRIGDWSGYTKIVGAGDLTGDGVGDVLARDRAGTLWRHDGRGNGTLKGRVKVFSGWGASYNAVVGVGDVTGDGRNDLVARDTAGNLYRQDGTGKGSFRNRTRIATGWQGYKGLF